MSSKPPDITADLPPSVLDFREYDDDAWYGVRLVLEGETLTVKFLDFGDESDKRLGPSDFEDPKALDDFAERFRPTSVQLQDGECRRLTEGKTVCASHTFGDNDVRFYDAVVETVYSSEHTFDKGEEQCLCEFVLFWQHGPIAGTKTLTGIEHICLIQPGSAENDPNLDFFLEISRKKLELRSHRASFVTEHEISANACAACFNETCGSAVKCEPNMPYKPQTFNSKEKKNPRQGHVTQTFKGYRNVRKKIGQDMDLGGGEYFFTKSLNETRNYHYILIENMETDLPLSVIVDFIYQQTSVSSHAYVTPSLLSESYTRGTIFLDGQEKLEKLSRFLHNPAHLIMSSRGRP
ncbi:uncharacterized protein LOC131258192 [Magnolia sinica]|uniref:uncharacterized protein LOC131258192 n=1 Tax=Magnolia sinica TaxID=86752 RepID=UPI00265A8C94|nr:uncharacterized protein LOC131258192 [Magnolia sinica]